MEVTSSKIIFVNTEVAFAEMVSKLKKCTAFGFDTEFDRFWREYGFKMLLMQIYDGEQCFLVDPLACKNLQLLWQIFEDDKICKIAYACSEDIQLLKINNCFPKNIFDVQIAAKLCNHASNSFGELVQDVCQVTLDKALQRSNWRTRPLSQEQQVYASNDVIFLLHLYNHFVILAAQQNVTYILQNENKACENVKVSEYEVKLTAKQKARYSPSYKQTVLALLILRDEVAKQNNLPPYIVFSDTVIETTVENIPEFIKNPFTKGFAHQFKNDIVSTQKFIDILNKVDLNKPVFAVAKIKSAESNERFPVNPNKIQIEEKCKKIHHFVTQQFGSSASDFILRGLKKGLQSKPLHEIGLRDYQLQIINTACKNLQIEL
jgi:ribonuclease D